MNLTLYVTDIALNTLQPHKDYVGIICKNAVSPCPHLSQLSLLTWPIERA